MIGHALGEEPRAHGGIVLRRGRMHLMPGGAQRAQERETESGERRREAGGDEDPHGWPPRAMMARASGVRRLTTNLNLLLAPFSIASGYS